MFVPDPCPVCCGGECECPVGTGGAGNPRLPCCCLPVEDPNSCVGLLDCNCANPDPPTYSDPNCCLPAPVCGVPQYFRRTIPTTNTMSGTASVTGFREVYTGGCFAPRSLQDKDIFGGSGSSSFPPISCCQASSSSSSLYSETTVAGGAPVNPPSRLNFSNNLLVNIGPTPAAIASGSFGSVTYPASTLPSSPLFTPSSTSSGAYQPATITSSVSWMVSQGVVIGVTIMFHGTQLFGTFPGGCPFSPTGIHRETQFTFTASLGPYARCDGGAFLMSSPENPSISRPIIVPASRPSAPKTGPSPCKGCNFRRSLNGF
jgi:hypothetical protein